MPTSGTSAYTANQSNVSNTDTITDFVSGSDKIQIDLNYSQLGSGLTIDATVQTARAGTSLIQDNLSANRGQAVYDTTGSALYVNVNADNLLTSTDYKINVNPAATATATIADGDINFKITGGAGADIITTGGGADTIVGGAGADVITAGKGIDSITSGSGIDKILYTSTTAVLLASEGGDTIGSFAGLNATNTTIVNFASGLLVNGTSNALDAVTGAGTLGANDVVLIASDAIVAGSDMATAAGALAGFNLAYTTITSLANGDRVLFVASGTATGTTANSYGWVISKGAGTLAAGDLTLAFIAAGVADATAAVFGTDAMTLVGLASAAANTDIFTIG